MGWPGAALAGPFEDAKNAHSRAIRQFTELEFDSAMETLEIALVQARGANMASESALAPLLVLRGGLLYAMTSNRKQAVAALREAIRADYHISLPVEMRTAELQALLDEARTREPRPDRGPIDHTPPLVRAGHDITVEAVSSVPLAKRLTMVMWWRRADSDADFVPADLETFGNLGVATITAAQHGDAGIEYFFSVSDAGRILASLGDKDAPLRLGQGQGQDAPPEAAEAGKTHQDPTRPPAWAGAWSRLYINLGVGTGVGVARGRAEQTYLQYTPKESYGVAQQACAIARWHANDGELPTSPTRFAEVLDPAMVPGGNIGVLQDSYDPVECAERQEVDVGPASAPLHLAPELMVKIHERDIAKGRSLAVLMGVFGRLQLITGSNVVIEDPNQPREQSYYDQARSNDPRGAQRKHDFTWAAGAKLKLLVKKRGGKLHGMFGLFGGYGRSRLMVDMGFSNDRNGNSVPDEFETPRREGPSGECVPVWPYNEGCVAGSFDEDLPESVRRSVPEGDRRIDTVRLGPGFVGVLVGFRYQPFKHFGIYGEVDVGGWFPNTSSVLVDFNVGPSITF